MVKKLFVCCCLLVLTACGVSGGVVVGNSVAQIGVVIDDPFISINDDDELFSITSSGSPASVSVSNRVVSLDGGALASVDRNSPTAPIRPPPGTGIAYLVDDPAGTLVAVNVEGVGASGNGLDDTVFGVWMSDFDVLNGQYSSERIGAFLFGRSTRGQDMPAFGSARYEGFMAAIERQGDGTTTLLDGPGSLTANFGSGRIDGRFTLSSDSGVWGSLDIDETVINGNDFRGNTVTTSRGHSGIVSGVFTGPFADEVGGVVDLSGADGSILQGGFGARLD